ncbi:MAG: hypothetical protein GX245_02245 [Eubacteriaceae bacterium]|nr:hypothetical protein [Eubacteriaceae bacterium]
MSREKVKREEILRAVNCDLVGEMGAGVSQRDKKRKRGDIAGGQLSFSGKDKVWAGVGHKGK